MLFLCVTCPSLSLCPCRILELEQIQAWWQHFNNESEAFSCWVCEREREVADLDLNSVPLDQQLQAVEVMFFTHTQTKPIQKSV